MSREELEKRALEARYNLVSTKDKETIDILEELAIKALEQDPVIEPLERLAESASKTAKVLERLDVLDEIRAEIAEFEERIAELPNMADAYATVRHCLEIIDKYRKEN